MMKTGHHSIFRRHWRNEVAREILEAERLGDTVAVKEGHSAGLRSQFYNRPVGTY